MNTSNTTTFQRLLPLLCLLLASSVANAKTHPSYLTPKYCESLTEQFVDNGMRSLGKYVNDNFQPEFTGGIRNTIDFLEKRSSWLSECNDYLLDTHNSSVFYSATLTREIFAAMEALAKELQHVREGVEYTDDSGNNNPKPVIKSRFDTLAKLVDQHHTQILLRKQFQ
ncbi:hypothetical protein [Microbulbifer sp. 2201CG32-9]|uniref:hypothetical protein n=1 Tax=unclassified Microbulbifer TaxID=2619833 RepID=UPI00345B98F0